MCTSLIKRNQFHFDGSLSKYMLTNENMHSRSMLTAVCGGAAVLEAMRASKTKSLCGAELNEYKTGLVLCSLVWPALYSRLFPGMFATAPDQSFLVGALAPSLYMAWLSTKAFEGDATRSFGIAFAKDAVVSTAILLMTTIGQRSPAEHTALRICLSIALLSALLDADEDDASATSFRAAVSAAMRAASLFTCVSVTLSPAVHPSG